VAGGRGKAEGELLPLFLQFRHEGPVHTVAFTLEGRVMSTV
jgi:hypothetical protein